MSSQGLISDNARADKGSGEATGRRKKPSTTTLILSGLGLGIGVGLFFGDIVSPLGFVGDAYVGLLQMTVLPFIVASLVSSIGALTPEQARALTKYGLLILAILWSLGAATVFVMALALPDQQVGSFFSTTLVEPPQEIDHIELYIPSNPFSSLANNYVPAVVLFCVLFGVAIMKLDGREKVIDVFDVAANALRRVTSFIMKLAPVGVFAISANAAGTLSLEEFGRLQGYLLILGGGAFLLTFWVLPMLVTLLTPFRYWQVLAASKDALITGFVTGSVFVVIPLLCLAISDLLKDQPTAPEGKGIRHDFLIPLAYSFPDSGKIFSLIFIPFAAWFYGNPLAWSDYPFLLLTGTFLAFGKLIAAIPFLLDAAQLPSDIFRLFLVSGVVASRFADLVGVMHLYVFTVLSTCALAGLAKFRPSRCLPALGGTLALGLGLVFGIRALLGITFADTYQKDKVLEEMQLLRSPVPASLLAVSAPNPVPLEGISRIERIRQRGIIRVGYLPDRLPFSYFNGSGQLVGLDVDLVHQLAGDLGVTIEFIPYDLETLAEELRNDHFDIAISGILATQARVERMLLSEPYLTAHMGLIVPDHRAGEFDEQPKIRRMDSVRFAVLRDSFFRNRVESFMPNAEVVELASEREFFDSIHAEVDGLLTTAEGGSAWTLLYPQYDFVSPVRPGLAAPVVIALGGQQDLIFEEVMSNWVDLQRLDGTIDKLFEYWVLGRPAHAEGPRWSIIRDVLQWVD